MTAFFIDLTAPRDRALIASDTLAYTVGGDGHAALGFTTKAIAFPHLRGAMIGAGLLDIHVRAAAHLMMQAEVLSFDAVIDTLPGILRAVTIDLAYERGIDDPDQLLLFQAGWVGFNEQAGQFELTLFSNYDGYVPRPNGGFTLVGIPNIPPSYLPPGFSSITSPEVRAIAALRATRKFTEDHGAAPIGGEIMLTDVRLDGVSSRVVARFHDFAKSRDAVADTWQDVLTGAHAGHGAIATTADLAAGKAKFEELCKAGAPPSSSTERLARQATGGETLTRQQRRAAEKAARKAGRRAA